MPVRFVFLCLTALILSSCGFPLSSPVLLKVGNKTWTVPDFKRAVDLHLKAGFSEQETPVPPAVLKKRVINELILKSLMEARTAKHSLTPLSMKGFDAPDKKLLARRGVSLRDFQERQRTLKLREAVLRRIRERNFHPSPKEIQEFYSKRKKDFFTPPACRLQQIFISSKGPAFSLFQRLQDGESFNRLARLYSTAPEKTKGGRLGWVSFGTLKVFDSACALEPGTLTSPQKSAYGWHIIQVLKKRPGRQKTLSEARGAVISALRRAGEEREFKKWLKNALSDTTVFLNENLLNSISIQYKVRHKAGL